MSTCKRRRPVYKLRQHANKRWYIHWSEERRSQHHSTGETDEAEAQAYFADWYAQRESLTTGLAGEALTISDLWRQYDERYVRLNYASEEAAIYSWKNLGPHFGNRTLKSINDAMIEDYIGLRTAGKIGRPSRGPTIRRELSILRACINWCAHPKRKIIDPSLVPVFDLPAAAKPRERWLKTAEIEKLLKAAGQDRPRGRLSRGERFLRLALETAARKEALLELTWDRVDFETNVIHLNVPGRRETKKRRANVPISAALLPWLKRAYDERESEYVLDSKKDIYSQVQVIALRAGFKLKGPRTTGITPHVLRHTAATHMARRGVSLWIISKILGNSIKMIEQVYAKHSVDDLRAGVDAITGNANLGTSAEIERPTRPTSNDNDLQEPDRGAVKAAKST